VWVKEAETLDYSTVSLPRASGRNRFIVMPLLAQKDHQNSEFQLLNTILRTSDDVMMCFVSSPIEALGPTTNPGTFITTLQTGMYTT
jgi:hypothetical protein